MYVFFVCLGILESLNNLPVHRPTSCFLELAEIASETMGGTSGGIYSLLLRGAARMAPDWVLAFKEAIETVKKYSPAREGCRTLVRCLQYFRLINHFCSMVFELIFIIFRL